MTGKSYLPTHSDCFGEWLCLAQAKEMEFFTAHSCTHLPFWFYATINNTLTTLAWLGTCSWVSIHGYIVRSLLQCLSIDLFEFQVCLFFLLVITKDLLLSRCLSMSLLFLITMANKCNLMIQNAKHKPNWKSNINLMKETWFWSKLKYIIL